MDWLTRGRDKTHLAKTWSVGAVVSHQNRARKCGLQFTTTTLVKRHVQYPSSEPE